MDNDLGHRLPFTTRHILHLKGFLEGYIPVTPNMISVRYAARSIDPDWGVPAIFRVQIDNYGPKQGQPTHGGQFEVECYLAALVNLKRQKNRSPSPADFEGPT